MAELDFQRLFRILNENGVRFILIGGMNYFLRFRPVTTQDIDVWISPAMQNIQRCEKAMVAIEAQWGRTDDDWGAVSNKPTGWLLSQSVFCLLTDCGLVDVFTSVAGLPDFETCWDRGAMMLTGQETTFRSLAAMDMLACQLAIPEENRRHERVAHLRRILEI